MSLIATVFLRLITNLSINNNEASILKLRFVCPKQYLQEIVMMHILPSSHITSGTASLDKDRQGSRLFPSLR